MGETTITSIGRNRLSRPRSIEPEARANVAATSAQAAHKIVVPNSIDMVALLGARDEFLRIVEKEFAADIMVRGNEITLSGEPAELALAERLIDELIAVVRTGH